MGGVGWGVGVSGGEWRGEVDARLLSVIVQFPPHEPRTRSHCSALCSLLATLMRARAVRIRVVFEDSKQVLIGLGEGGGWRLGWGVKDGVGGSLGSYFRKLFYFYFFFN